MTEMPKLSVLIVNWNAADVIGDCLESIYKTAKVPYEIIVVDNHSADESVKMIKIKFPSVKLIEAPENLGFARANNLAFSMAIGEYALLLNPDAVLLDGAINKMLNFLECHSDIGIIGPKIIGKDNEVTFLCKRKLPSLGEEVRKLFLIQKLNQWMSHCLTSLSQVARSRILSYYELAEECECIQGSCMLLKSSVFKALHGFDESVAMYLDDIDICFRTRKMGLKVYYLADASIVHLGQHSTKKAKNFKLYDVLFLEAHSFYYRKHYGHRKDGLFKLILALSIPYLLLLDAFAWPWYLITRNLREWTWMVQKHVGYIQVLLNNKIQWQ